MTSVEGDRSHRGRCHASECIDGRDGGCGYCGGWKSRNPVILQGRRRGCPNSRSDRRGTCGCRRARMHSPCTWLGRRRAAATRRRVLRLRALTETAVLCLTGKTNRCRSFPARVPWKSEAYRDRNYYMIFSR